MKSAITVLRMLLRLDFLALLALGILLWAGDTRLQQIHIALGFLFAALVVIEAFVAAASKVSLGLAAIAIVWALLLPVVGLGQHGVLVGGAHWLVRIFHLFFGLGLMGVAEVMGKRAATNAAR
jgi:hypothetical protein